MHLFSKCRCAVFTAGLLLSCAVSQAQEAFEFFHPLTVRRPVIEQQIEIQGAPVTSETARTSAWRLPWITVLCLAGKSNRCLFGFEKSIREKTDFDTQLRLGLVWDFPSRNK